MSANLEAKKVLVEEIKEKISKAKSLAFVDYRGMTVVEDTELRNEFRKVGAEYRVYKNRLVLRALTELGITGCEEYLQGTNAVAFGFEDEVAPAKILVDKAKATKKLEIKFGIIDGKVISAEKVGVLAKLPPKPVLVAQLLSMLNAPATGLVSVLNGPMRGLAVALNAIAEKK